MLSSETVFLSRSEFQPQNLSETAIIDTYIRNSTVGDVARKVMGDVPIAYVEGAGGTRVSEDEIVAVGKYDVSEVEVSPHEFDR